MNWWLIIVIAACLFQDHPVSHFHTFMMIQSDVIFLSSVCLNSFRLGGIDELVVEIDELMVGIN